MKIGVCIRAKNEQKIINDWVAYYLQLGFDKIIIYDNLYDLASASRIQIPNHDLLRDEMLYLQRRYTPTGYRVFAKKDGLVKTDDVVDALAGAAYACMHETFERLPQGLLVRMGVNSMTDGVVFRGMQGIPLDSTSEQRKWSTRF